MCVGRTGASVAGVPVLAGGMTTLSAFAIFPIAGYASGPERADFLCFGCLHSAV